MNIEESIKSELVKTLGDAGGGWSNRTQFGYHSFEFDGVNIIGQRRPKIRIEELKKYIDFENKNVVDFGCNVGGMLFELKNDIKSGKGYDFDKKVITCANNIKNILKVDNLSFFRHDLDRDDYNKIDINDTDIIFILSLGSWVKTWKKLYDKCILSGSDIILETNNDVEGKPQLDFFRQKGLNVKLIIDNSKDDTTNNNKRKTYLITK